MNTFTPKPRDLNEEEVKLFGLRCVYPDSILEPVCEDTTNVWAKADTGKLLTYRLYSRGTNDLLILRYTPDLDIWEEVELENIRNLYGLIWKLITKIEHQKFELKEIK